MWDGANITADITGAEKTFYARGAGLIFSEANGQKQYYAFNGHGDTVSVTDAQGNLLQGYDYDAFGNEKGTAQAITNPFRYSGEYYDEEAGLIYLRNRYYAPESGRFTQEDPIKDGLNWFVYCGNNPISFLDPTGLAITDEDKAAYANGSMTQSDWELLNKADNLWNSAHPEDYSTKATARAMAMAARELYTTSDNFDYTFGTGYSALDNGGNGAFMKTLYSKSSDGTLKALTTIRYIRTTLPNGRKMLTLVEAYGYSMGSEKLGIYASTINYNVGGSPGGAFYGSSANSGFSCITKISVMEDHGSGTVMLGVAVDYFFNDHGKQLTISVSHNVYQSHYYDENGKWVSSTDFKDLMQGRTKYGTGR